ncbi:hypothetical protein GJAV_G00061070 [Gymnothorax javanicus]|nr:hypothetical protein GJAV_G00061070 [Gymnothorax javanicus]
MPSYALNPLLDEAFFDDVLCQKFLSLDLRDPPESLLSVMPIGYRAMEAPSSLSLGANSSTVESGDSAAMACGYWGQHMEQPCPPRSRWKKISFCSERSVSVVEAGMSGHRWPSVAGESCSNGHCPQPAATSSAQNSLLSSSSSSRYKTELCRTFAESGACKYGGKCQFAHGVEELRDLSRHPKYKTEPCRTFHTIGYCPYGIRCHFVHNNEDDLGSARSLPPAQPRTTRRPPLLRQSISFAGFPSVPLLPELLRVNPFLCAPAISPPVSADFPEPLSQASPLSAFFDPPQSQAPTSSRRPKIWGPRPAALAQSTPRGKGVGGGGSSRTCRKALGCGLAAFPTPLCPTTRAARGARLAA